MTQAKEGSISFNVPPDLPGVATVIRLEGNRNISSYLNTCHTLKRIRQSASRLHFRGRAYTALGHASALVSLLDPGEMLRTSHVQIPETIEGVMIAPEFMQQFAAELGLRSSSLWFSNSFQNHPDLAHGLDNFFHRTYASAYRAGTPNTLRTSVADHRHKLHENAAQARAHRSRPAGGCSRQDVDPR